MKPSY
jgi:hypothetical protein